MTNEQIENTVAFKGLNNVTQSIYKQKAMMDRVKSELKIAKHIGFDTYKEVYHPRPYLENVIQELLILETQANNIPD